jgi:phage terminase large subunit-like protein
VTTAIQPLDQADTPLVSVGSWMPTRYTPSLTGTEVFRTDGDRLLRFGARHIRIAEAAVLRTDPWQEWLIRHVLERYPDDWPIVHLRGQLRFRQVVISMGRQNGKSLLAVFFALYFLCLHVRGPRVLGMASVDRQAKIVYDRVRYAVDNDPALSRDLRATGTRGIWRRDKSGVYLTLPSREDSAQGEPASGVIADELHLLAAALWDALVLAQKSKTNALLLGITTAGDDSSELLIRLYRDGEQAINGEDERFGFFCWEAPDDELTEAGVIAANPAVACGRISLEQTMADAVKMWNDTQRGPDGLTGRQRCIRYTLNRFIGGAADAWTNTHAWAATVTHDPISHVGDVVYTIERTEEWEWASVLATSRTGNAYATELVASIPAPTPELLADVCRALARRGRCEFAIDRRTLNSLGKKLEEEGYTVHRLIAEEMATASQTAHALISRRTVAHPDDPLVRLQSARARRRYGENGWTISRGLSGTDIDTTIALAMGLYVTSLHDERPRSLVY